MLSNFYFFWMEVKKRTWMVKLCHSVIFEYLLSHLSVDFIAEVIYALKQWPYYENDATFYKYMLVLTKHYEISNTKINGLYQNGAWNIHETKEISAVCPWLVTYNIRHSLNNIDCINLTYYFPILFCNVLSL